MNDSTAVIQQYLRNLDGYSLEQLRYKCDEDVWSLGQMHIHVIEVAKEYMDHMETCAKAAHESSEGKTADGAKALAEQAWPNIRVKLEEPPNATRNPESKDEIRAGLEHVLERLAYWADCVQEANPACKVRHGWFGWLNAREWLAMVGMHGRHHLRQKAVLDEKLAEAGLR
ncbi:DinB superfamily protein [Paenibacillus sp. UNC496MF]|uniref:DinB family protein n=1 Tax=Paenibacillus sp. UNC496MF TaxID=1502753 RepID=UPI0008EC3ACF|nr:DinB family protein [Paenibacillus sp. UNC496MF]SFJ36544.1 DinB superfamily protein [Paenibacillus sp. UNC496MF]